MDPQDQVPMIWTTHGNLPVEILDYKTEWTDGQDEITMAEVYQYNGEVVRRSVHVYKKQGASMGADQAVFG